MASSAPAIGYEPEAFHVPPSLTPPEGFQTIVEGSATALYPAGRAVFYNPAQVYNRDLSTAAMRVLSKERRLQWSKPEAACSEITRRLRRATARSEPLGQWVPPALRDILLPPSAQEAEWVDLFRAGATGADPKPEGEAEVAVGQSAMPAAAADAGARVGSTLGIEIVEALAASGLRSVRYAAEVEGLEAAIVSDIDAAAVKACRANVAFNGLDPSVVRPCQADAVTLLQSLRLPEWRVDWIDLDPYGTPIPFIEASVAAINDGGILALTATDMIVLAGSMRAAAHGKYGSMAIKSAQCHELALRTLIFTVATAAARAKRVVEPLISINADFYCRILFRVSDNAAGAQMLPLVTGSLGLCMQCGTRQWQPAGRIGVTATAKHTDKDGQPLYRSKKHKRLVEGKARREAHEQRVAQRTAPHAAASSSSSTPATAAATEGDRTTGCCDVTAAPTPAAAPPTIGQTVLSQGRALALGLIKAADRSTPSLHCQPQPATMQKLCPNCQSPVHVAGPYWTGPIHTPAFVRAVLEEVQTLQQSGAGSIGGGYTVDRRSTAILPGRVLPAEAAVAGVRGAGSHLSGAAVVPRSSSPSGLAGAELPQAQGISAGLSHKEGHDAGSNDMATVQASRDRLVGTLRMMAREVGGEEVDDLYALQPEDAAPVAGSAAWAAAYPGTSATPNKLGNNGTSARDSPAEPVVDVSTARDRSVTSRQLSQTLYWDLHAMGSVTKLPNIPRKALAACLLNEGYSVSDSHCGAIAFKTDAPEQLVWDAVRVYGWKKSKKDPKLAQAEAAAAFEEAKKEADAAAAAPEQPARTPFSAAPAPEAAPAAAAIAAPAAHGRPTKKRRRPGKALFHLATLARPLVHTELQFEPRNAAVRCALQAFQGEATGTTSSSSSASSSWSSSSSSSAGGEDGRVRWRKFDNPRAQWGPQQRALGERPASTPKFVGISDSEPGNVEAEACEGSKKSKAGDLE